MGRKESDMSNLEEINRVIERAKNQRADLIGSAVRAYALPVALAAGLSLMLLGPGGKPPVETNGDEDVSQAIASLR